MQSRFLRLVGVAAVAVTAACGRAPEPPALDRAAAAAPPTTAPTTTAPPTSTVAPAPSSTTTQPPAVAAAAAPADLRSWQVAGYEGLGAWLDAFDWSEAFVRDPSHLVGPEAIDHMAAEGVQTLYIQANRWNNDARSLEPARFAALVDQAHRHGITVIGWYLPTLVDPDEDLARLLAIAESGVDGLAVDIEARDVADVAERNRRLVWLSQQLRAAMGDRPIGAIVLEPVLLEEVNPRYWPDFPWAEIAPFYDVWLPMSYYTNRRGEWRDAYRYSVENIVRIRLHIGDVNAPVHLIGGIGDRTTLADIEATVRAGTEHGVLGGSIYDYRTSTAEMWEPLRRFVRPSP